MKRINCKFCRGNGKPACDIEDKDEYVCTRTVGHTGNHVACGVDDKYHPIREWSDDE